MKKIVIPDWLEVKDWERNVLEILRERLGVLSHQDLELGQTDRRQSGTVASSADD